MYHGRGIERGIVRSNQEIAPGHRVLQIELCGEFGGALPGQFVMIRQEECEEPLLARPFSICSLDEESDTVKIELLYRIVGKGTALMAALKNGDTLSVMGPLGRGFDSAGDARKIVLVAGGVGVAPLIYYAEFTRRMEDEHREIILYLGARNDELLVGLDRLEGLCDEVKIATDDGSSGFKGTVSELFARDLDSCRGSGAVVKICGPRAMMSSLAKLMSNSGLHCQVSLEERMACGIGVCLGCAVRVRSDEATPRYLRVCKEGPVFDMGEIEWHDS